MSRKRCWRFSTSPPAAYWICSGAAAPDGPAAISIRGGRLFLYAAAVTWLSDTFAYFLGSLFGRIPGTAVSPANPSRRGGRRPGRRPHGLAARALLGVLSEPGRSAGAGLALSVAGLLGDLFESLLKRDAAVKDTGG